VLRDDGHNFAWLTNGTYIPAHVNNALDYWVVELSSEKWIVHSCNEVWWDGQGEVPALPTPHPALYLTCPAKQALALIRESPLGWSHLTKRTGAIKDVLYEEEKE